MISWARSGWFFPTRDDFSEISNRNFNRQPFRKGKKFISIQTRWTRQYWNTYKFEPQIFDTCMRGSRAQTKKSKLPPWSTLDRVWRCGSTANMWLFITTLWVFRSDFPELVTLRVSLISLGIDHFWWGEFPPRLRGWASLPCLNISITELAHSYIRDS